MTMQQQFFLFLAALSLLIIMPGCKKGVLYRQPASSIKLQEAHIVDIPVPLQSKVLSHHFSQNENGGFFMGYSTHLKFDELFNFYATEMERFGWQGVGVARGSQEIIMVFEKPARFAVISFRTSGSSSLIIISSGKKEEGSSYE